MEKPENLKDTTLEKWNLVGPFNFNGKIRIGDFYEEGNGLAPYMFD